MSTSHGLDDFLLSEVSQGRKDSNIPPGTWGSRAIDAGAARRCRDPLSRNVQPLPRGFWALRRHEVHRRARGGGYERGGRSAGAPADGRAVYAMPGSESGEGRNAGCFAMFFSNFLLKYIYNFWPNFGKL